MQRTQKFVIIPPAKSSSINVLFKCLHSDKTAVRLRYPHFSFCVTFTYLPTTTMVPSQRQKVFHTTSFGTKIKLKLKASEKSVLQYFFKRLLHTNKAQGSKPNKISTFLYYQVNCCYLIQTAVTLLDTHAFYSLLDWPSNPWNVLQKTRIFMGKTWK